MLGEVQKAEIREIYNKLESRHWDYELQDMEVRVHLLETTLEKLLEILLEDLT